MPGVLIGYRSCIDYRLQSSCTAVVVRGVSGASVAESCTCRYGKFTGYSISVHTNILVQKKAFVLLAPNIIMYIRNIVYYNTYLVQCTQKETLPRENLLQYNTPKTLIASTPAAQMRRPPQQETNDLRINPYSPTPLKVAWGGFLVQVHYSNTKNMAQKRSCSNIRPHAHGLTCDQQLS